MKKAHKGLIEGLGGKKPRTFTGKCGTLNFPTKSKIRGKFVRA